MASKYELLSESTEPNSASSYDEKNKDYRHFLEVNDRDDAGGDVTDTENVDGSDGEENEIDEVKELDLGDQNEECSVQDQSKPSPSMLSIPEDNDDPLTDREDMSDSANDDSENEGEPWTEATITKPLLNVDHLKPRLSIRSKRTTLKKLHQHEAYDQLTSTSATTDVESLSDSDDGGQRKERHAEEDDVAVSSDSEDTEGEVLSVSNSDTEQTMDPSKNPHNQRNPQLFNEGAGLSTFMGKRGSISETDELVLSDPEVELPVFATYEPSRVFNNQGAAQNLVQLIFEVDDGVTDIEDMSGESEDEGNDDLTNTDLTEYPLFGGEVSWTEKQEQKCPDGYASNIQSPNTDEEDDSGSDDDLNEKYHRRRKSLFLSGLESGDNVIKMDEMYNLSIVHGNIEKKPVKIVVSGDEKLANHVTNYSDDSSDIDGAEAGKINSYTDSEYHTGSEEENLLSLTEFLTVGGSGQCTSSSNSGGATKPNIRPRFRKRRQKAKVDSA